jgi:hypothetical protein
MRTNTTPSADAPAMLEHARIVYDKVVTLI